MRRRNAYPWLLRRAAISTCGTFGTVVTEYSKAVFEETAVQITRRLILASAAATALTPPRAFAAPELALDAVRTSFSLELPEQQNSFFTGLSARPGGFLLVHSAESPVFGRNFALDGAPAGDRFSIVPNDVDGTSIYGAFPDPVAFEDGSALVIFTGTVKREGALGVYARPIAADGRKGAFVRISHRKDEWVEATAARFGADAVIAVWRTWDPIGGPSSLRWRIVGSDGRPRGAVRTLAAPAGISQFYPRGIASLTGGGAAIAYIRAADGDPNGKLCVQRISPEGETIGRPAILEAHAETGIWLAGLSGNRLAACFARADGNLDLQVFPASGPASSPVVVSTGFTSISSVALTRPAVPGAAAKGLAILVAGGEGRRGVLSLLLVDEAGQRLAAPARIIRTADGPVVFGRRVEALHLAALENGDLIAVHLFKSGFSDTTPPLGSIIRIAAA